MSLTEDPGRRDVVAARLRDTGRQVIDLSEAQIVQYAGNAIQLSGSAGRILCMSTTARNSLTQARISLIERSAPIVALDISTIERAGGSVRCTIAGLHLSPRTE